MIVGEEILTKKGEILAVFVKEALPKGIEPIEAFKRLRDQGAFISLSHPYAPMRHGWTEAEMEETASFLDKVYKGNVGLMISTLIGSEKLTEEQLAELRRIIEEG